MALLDYAVLTGAGLAAGLVLNGAKNGHFAPTLYSVPNYLFMAFLVSASIRSGYNLVTEK